MARVAEALRAVTDTVPTAQERMAHLSANVVHRVTPTATHDSLLVGVDSSASAQAILDVVASARTASPLR